jgi:Mn-dependent DtxR family transcriptional regulator
MQIYFTEDKTIIDKVTGEVFNLEEELGVWTWERKVYVYNKLSSKEKFKTLIHEVVECFLVVYLGVRQEKAHRVASLVEKIVGFLKN